MSNMKDHQVNSENAEAINAEIAERNSLLEVMSYAAYTFEGQADDEALGWRAAACYAINTLKVLGEHCRLAIVQGDYTLATLLYSLMMRQLEFMEEARQENRSGVSLQELYVSKVNAETAVSRLRANQSLVEGLAAEFGSESSVSAFEKGVYAAFAAVVKEAASSILFGVGKPEEYYSDEVAQRVSEDLVSQIMETGRERAEAEAAVAGILGADLESRKKWLVNDICFRNRLDSENVRMGIALTGNLELWIAANLLTKLSKQAV